MYKSVDDFLKPSQDLSDVSFWKRIGTMCVEKFFENFVCGIGKDFKSITDIITISIDYIEHINSNDCNFIIYSSREYSITCGIDIIPNTAVKCLKCFNLFKTALLSAFKAVINNLLPDLNNKYGDDKLSDEIVKYATYKAANDLRSQYLKELGVDIDIFCILMAFKYEKRTCSECNILFVKNSSSIRNLDEFCEVKIEKNNIRQIRKLLELLNNNNRYYNLVCDIDKAQIIGITHLDLSKTGESVYRLSISDRNWKLYNGSDCVCQFSDGNFKIIEVDINIFGFNPCINKIVKNIFNNCNHGALIFVFPNEKAVKNAVNDLSDRKRIYRLSKPSSEVDLISRFCEIDGAIFLDNSGKCYGFGGISEGDVKVNGNMARGARYNAAITYAMSDKSHPLAVIISEDGGIDCKCHEKCKIITPNESCYKENPHSCA